MLAVHLPTLDCRSSVIRALVIAPAADLLVRCCMRFCRGALRSPSVESFFVDAGAADVTSRLYEARLAAILRMLNI